MGSPWPWDRWLMRYRPPGLFSPRASRTLRRAEAEIDPAVDDHGLAREVVVLEDGAHQMGDLGCISQAACWNAGAGGRG